MNQIKQLAGHLGGTQTLNRYGREYYQAIGRKGGRPKNRTLAELRQRQILEDGKQNKAKEVRLPQGLVRLKELLKSQNNHIPGGLAL